MHLVWSRGHSIPCTPAVNFSSLLHVFVIPLRIHLNTYTCKHNAKYICIAFLNLIWIATQTMHHVYYKQEWPCASLSLNRWPLHHPLYLFLLLLLISAPQHLPQSSPPTAVLVQLQTKLLISNPWQSCFEANYSLGVLYQVAGFIVVWTWYSANR